MSNLPKNWDSMSLPRLWDALNNKRHVASAVETLCFELRSWGLAEVANPHCQARLAALSREQLSEVVASLRRMQPRYPAITDELISFLEQVPK